jgi:hypothetical protein
LIDKPGLIMTFAYYSSYYLFYASIACY